MSEPAGDDRPILAVYVVWHPEAAVSADLASAIFRELCADPDVPARRGLGIPVRFRSSDDPTTAPAPIPIGLRIAAHSTVASKRRALRSGVA